MAEIKKRAHNLHKNVLQCMDFNLNQRHGRWRIRNNLLALMLAKCIMGQYVSPHKISDTCTIEVPICYNVLDLD